MASARDLRRRITTVKNTQQTTRAMKLVSAAKLRRAQDAIFAHRPYAKQLSELTKLVASIAHRANCSELSPLIQLERQQNISESTALVCVLSSDRGLCGGFNSNVIRTVQRWAATEGARFRSIRVVCIGKKALEFLKHRKSFEIEKAYELGRRVSFLRAKEVSNFLVESFLSGRSNEVFIAYNEFKNAAVQKVVIEQFLPVDVASVVTEHDDSRSDLILVRPDPMKLLDELLKKQFSVHIYRALLESQASEHGARMSAMENATKNAGEMIQKLTLQYNKQRQAGITKELLEIISGSESQKG